ncbi:MAG: DUF2254 family protein [Polyangiaceae bacterium]
MKSQVSHARTWVLQIAVLGGAALLVFWGFYAWDVARAAKPSALDNYLEFDPGSITDAVSSLAGMILAVFGIVITVVSIIVQLSAERYTGVARMFLRDRVNLSVMAYYVVACVCGVCVSLSLHHDFVPVVTLAVMLMATAFGLVLMAPYFSYVFWFLEPMNIIARIRRDAVNTIVRGSAQTDPERSAQGQVGALAAMEELTDLTSNSISGKDKIIASGAVDAIKDFTLEYLAKKSSASPVWFKIGPGIRENPDFVAMDPESLADLEERRTWVEWKAMRQYFGIYNEALGSMRDINYLIAIDTRYIGEAAGAAKDEELMTLVFRYMNSYMRATLNARDVRTAYNVLNQYRLLIEALISQGNGEQALAGVKHMNYYGHVSFDMKLTFVTETVAYDVSTLIQHAHSSKCPQESEMLAEFLELDRQVRVRSQEKALLGVRKAQVKLAAYYLHQQEVEKARTIADDMAEEPRERLITIRAQLEGVTTKDFWEIIDRGRNFEFMPAPQREQMEVFFDWLHVEKSDPASSPSPG